MSRQHGSWFCRKRGMSVSLLAGMIALGNGAANAQSVGQTRTVQQETGTRTDTLPEITNTLDSAKGIVKSTKVQKNVRLFKEQAQQYQRTGSHQETRSRQVSVPYTATGYRWVSQQVWIPDPPPPPPQPSAAERAAAALAAQITARAASIAASWRTSTEFVLNVMAQEQRVSRSQILSTPGALQDPLVLDLSGNGKIDVTGKSSAKQRSPENLDFVAAGSVKFDLLGIKKEIQTEWIKSDEGLLVDNRNDKARKLVEAGKNLSIRNLLGNTNGHLGGFSKLIADFKVEPLSGGKVLRGKALDDLLVWVDANADGKAILGELKTLSSLGISEILLPEMEKRIAGEVFEQALFVRDGKPFVMQEVWFATMPDVAVNATTAAN